MTAENSRSLFQAWWQSGWAFATLVILVLVIGFLVAWALAGDSRQPGTADNVVPQRSVAAFNLTHGRPAGEGDAEAGDLIEYTLMYRQATGGGSEQVAIEAEVGDLLPYVEIMDFGGAALVENRLAWPAETLSPSGELEHRFLVEVRPVRQADAPALARLQYGNSTEFKIKPETIAITTTTERTPSQVVRGASYRAPRSGPEHNLALVLAGLLTAGVIVYNYRRRQNAEV